MAARATLAQLIAHKLIRLIYLMLTRKEPYRDSMVDYDAMNLQFADSERRNRLACRNRQCNYGGVFS